MRHTGPADVSFAEVRGRRYDAWNAVAIQSHFEICLYFMFILFFILDGMPEGILFSINKKRW